jgi:hypothetical protein
MKMSRTVVPPKPSACSSDGVTVTPRVPGEQVAASLALARAPSPWSASAEGCKDGAHPAAGLPLRDWPSLGKAAASAPPLPTAAAANGPSPPNTPQLGMRAAPGTAGGQSPQTLPCSARPTGSAGDKDTNAAPPLQQQVAPPLDRPMHHTGALSGSSSRALWPGPFSIITKTLYNMGNKSSHTC